MLLWQEFGSTAPIDTVLDDQRKCILELGKVERQNRYDVLPVLLDVTNTLSRLSLPFRGHDETDESTNKGVFLEIVDLLARWNPMLENHLNESRLKPKSYPSYISSSCLLYTSDAADE